MIPYSFGIQCGDDRVQVELEDGHFEESNEDLSGIYSGTQRPTSYIINCPSFKFRVNFIDTPGIGDTRLANIQYFEVIRNL